MSSIDTLLALSPLDGRYASKTRALEPIMSEYGLSYYRTLIEIRWLLYLCDCEGITEATPLSAEHRTFLEQIIKSFNLESAKAVKKIEQETNHDVKAIEYYLQKKLQDTPLERLTPFIHFACTSEDINNLAYALMWKDAQKIILNEALTPLQHALFELMIQTRSMPMLSRTHGQAATPTTLGKEMANFHHRLASATEHWSTLILPGKFNGAVGNFNAHQVAYPEVNWLSISQNFVTSLDLVWQSHSTQIEPHDTLAESLHALTRINTILIDLARDLWGYISLGYFKQKKVATEVGSSTMPHKVNPIDFENAEGNLGMANALACHMASKLPCSRWQRDLTDSTVMRNLGTVLGYSLLSYQSLLKGFSKLEPQPQPMTEELNQHWEVLAEPIQTVMRRHGFLDAYEQLKALTRGSSIQKEDLHTLIQGIDIPEADKKRLLALTPSTYLGLALELVDHEISSIKDKL